MRKVRNGILLSSILGLSSTSAFAEQLNISGFARLLGGVTDSKDVSYLGYDNSFSFTEHSLVAMQADLGITDKLSATTQVIYHSDDNRKSGVEWAYLTYKQSKKLKFKVGKLRTPFFNYSDVIDVGFAYPWISPPKQVYQSFLFSNFDGVNVTYNSAINGVSYDVEGYWGKFDDDINHNNREYKTDVKDLRGLVSSFSVNNLSVRLSYHTARVLFIENDLELLASTLNQLGFVDSAKSISAKGDINNWQASVSYNALDYFAQFEVMKIDGNILPTPKTLGYYVSFGYHFPQFTLHYTFADHDSEFAQPLNEIPDGSPQLELLRQKYESVFTALVTNDIKTNTLGVRWDYSNSTAFKFDITHLSGQTLKPGSPQANTNQNALLLQAGIEWVF